MILNDLEPYTKRRFTDFCDFWLQHISRVNCDEMARDRPRLLA